MKRSEALSPLIGCAANIGSARQCHVRWDLASVVRKVKTKSRSDYCAYIKSSRSTVVLLKQAR